MAYQPNLISDFVDRTNDGMLTNIGAGVNQVVSSKQAEIAAAKKEAAWQEGLGTFMRDRTYESGMALYNANPEKWEEFKAADTAMTEMEQTQRVQKNMEYISLLETDPEGAVNLFKEERDANLADGNPENDNEAAALDDLISKIENGQASEVSTLLQLRSIGMGDIGQKALEATYANFTNRRAEENQMIDFIESGVGLTFTSTEHENEVLTGANKMKFPWLARLYAELGSVAGGADKLTGTSLADYTFKTNKEYNARIEDYRTASDAAATIYAAAKPNSGFSDDAILKLFNKVLDPDSVVRQSELEATLAAQGKLEEFRNLIPRWGTGVTLNDTTRPKLLEIVRIIDEASQEKVRGIQEEMNPLVDTFIGKDSRDLIYGPPEDAIENVKKDVEAEEEAKLEATRAKIREMNPNSTGKIEEMSMEELAASYQKSFPVASKAVTEAVGSTTTINGEVFEVFE